MTFVQIVSFSTDHFDQFQPLEDRWKAATEGRRTLLRDQVYVDRGNPRHYLVVNEFESYESAMVNSGLPETSELAKAFGMLVDGAVEYTDLDLMTQADVRHQLAARLRQGMETTTFTDELAGDVVADAYFPDYVQRLSGPAALQDALAEEAPGREFDRWEIVTTENGFAGEYAYRTTGTATSYLSIGTLLATVTAGRISHLIITCAGSWDADTESRILAGVGRTS
jgi:hypothetical protein